MAENDEPRECPDPDVTRQVGTDATLLSPDAKTVESGPPVPARTPPGAWLGRYSIGESLGAGGMGEVYRALDLTLHRFVALKLLHSDRPDLLGRFLLEARAQARVDHPNVCKVHEAGEEGGRPFIAMQLVEGRSLSEAAREMSLEEKVTVMRQVAEAVHAAHRTGLIHRDIKPSNVLVQRDEEGRLHPYVLDFGLAKEASAPGMTVSGMVVGTPSYMAPEQARGEEADRRSDIYGLGATLYEALCGEPPVKGETALEIMMGAVQGEVRRPRSLVPDLPADVETVVLKCLDLDPARRYDTARALADDLARFLDGEPIAARPPSVIYRLSRKVRKNRTLVVVSAIGLLAALGGAGAALVARWQAYEGARIARQLGQEVKDVETELRLARMLPLHDLRPVRRKARAHVTDLRGRMEKGAAEGPGRYLLGRALLALGDLDGARTELARAEALGFRDPGLDFALGRTLGELYRLRREEAERGRERSEARLKELETTLRDAALAHLRAARLSESEALLAEGLIAFHEKRYEEARARATLARARTPWLWEASTLEGDVWNATGSEKGKVGDPDGALADFEKAGAAFAAAAEVGRSDASLQVRDAARWTRVMEVEHIRGRPVDAAFRKAQEACGRARTADPDDPEPDSIEAAATWRRAENGMGRGEDPRPLYEKAIALGEAAATRGSLSGWTQAGTAWHGLAMYESQKGLDPVAALEKAGEAYERGIRANPGSPSVRTNAGFALIVRAEHEMNLGHDPTSFLKRAIEHEEEALKLDPGLFTAANSLGYALQKAGEWEKMKGRDPRPLLSKAETALDRTVSLNPKFAFGFVNLGNVLLVRGEWERLSGLDPTASLDRALACYRTARTLAPGHAVSNVTLGFAAHQKALYFLEKGKTPEAVLAEGRDALGQALAANPSFAIARQKLGELEIVAGRFDIAQGRSPEAAFSRAESSLSKAKAALATAPGVFSNLAELERWRAESALSAGRSPAPAIARGLAAAGQALVLNAADADSFAARGALLLLSAKIQQSPPTRAAMARDALAALEKAVGLNGLLKREVEPLAAEARSLGQR